VPVFAGQINHHASFSPALAVGASAGESEPHSLAAAEIREALTTVEKSVAAIYAGAAAATSLTQAERCRRSRRNGIVTACTSSVVSGTLRLCNEGIDRNRPCL